MTNKYSSYLTIILVFTLTMLIFSCNKKVQHVKSVAYNSGKNVDHIYKVELENGTWITDKILGLDPSIRKYNLTRFITKKFAGNLTSFPNKVNFNSRYVAPCGNDNFTTVIGKYEFFDKDKISISVDSIIYDGEWKKPTEYRNSKEIIYVISKVGDSIILTNQ